MLTRASLGFVLSALAFVAAVTSACGGGAPAAPTSTAPPQPTLSFSITPPGGTIVWEYGPAITFPRLTPTLAFTARITAPATTLGDAFVAVRLLNDIQAVCFQAAGNVGPLVAGRSY
jgi:hypothetical protein